MNSFDCSAEFQIGRPRQRQWFFMVMGVTDNWRVGVGGRCMLLFGTLLISYKTARVALCFDVFSLSRRMSIKCLFKLLVSLIDVDSYVAPPQIADRGD